MRCFIRRFCQLFTLHYVTDCIFHLLWFFFFFHLLSISPNIYCNTIYNYRQQILTQQSGIVYRGCFLLLPPAVKDNKVNLTQLYCNKLIFWLLEILMNDKITRSFQVRRFIRNTFFFSWKGLGIYLILYFFSRSSVMTIVYEKHHRCKWC